MTAPSNRNLAPSRSRNPLVSRARLLAPLDGRFERRLTFIQAGAGFGKTTLLADSIDRNLEDSAGLDVWYGLGPQDERSGELGAGLSRAFGLEPDRGDPVSEIVNAVLKESPQDVAIILDDIHYLRAGGSGAELLERLLHALPANGHMVLASREAPGFPIARMIAQGEAILIEEAELAFDEDEQAQFLGDRGASLSGSDLGGWPALLELAVSTGADRVGEFLWEEVIAGLTSGQLRALARLAPLDWIDRARILAFTGEPLDVGSLLGDFPLLRRDREGRARLHGLWSPFIAQADPEWTEDEFTTALHHLCETECFREAVELCVAFDRPDRIIDIVRRLVGVFRWLKVTATEFETLLAVLPPELRGRPEGMLFEGFLSLNTEPVAAFARLDAAMRKFAESRETELQLAAAMALSMLTFFAVNAEGFRHYRKITEHIDHPYRECLDALGEGIVEMLEARPVAALESIAKASATGVDMSQMDDVVAVLALLDAGQPSVALNRIRQKMPSANALSRTSFLSGQQDALWLEGEIDEAALARLDGPRDERLGGHLHNRTVFHAVLSFQNAITGRRDAAREHLALSRAGHDSSVGSRAQMAIAAASAACVAMDGDEIRAGSEFSEAFSAHPPAARVHRHTLRAAPLIWVLSPSLRGEIEDWHLGYCYAFGLEIARALVALREEGNFGPAHDLDWSQHQRFRVFLLPGMILELAVAATAMGNSEARGVARAIAEQNRPDLEALRRRHTHQNREGHERFASVAEDLFATVPARPAGHLSVHVLGPLEVRLDGVAVDHPSMRRNRVRALLQYLAGHDWVSRAEVCGALWPDKDEATSGNNLRVNLNHLLRLLEPDRSARDPSFSVESEGERLRLRLGEWLSLDAKTFEMDLDEGAALDRAGDPTAALEIYERALSLYRGDYLVDATDETWIGIERTRLRSRFVAAAIRTGNLRLGRGDFDGAFEITRRVLEIDDLNEDAFRLQALLYFRRGDRAAAGSVLRNGLEKLKAADIAPDPELTRLLRRTGR